MGRSSTRATRLKSKLTKTQAMELDEFLAEWRSDSPTVSVRTSGSTGKPKPMTVEKSRMKASANMTCDFLGLRDGDSALLCMPLDYIAGKMVVVRAEVRGLRLIAVTPSSHPFAKLDSPTDFAALTPMQVFETLKVERERRLLMGVRQLIIGGGAISAEMASELKSFPNAVWSTYGMTETLSHIALRRLSGDKASEWYTPFKGVNLTADSRGCLIIDAPAICAKPLITNDIVEFDADGTQFKITGRADNVICSGGIKVQAEEVERMLEPYIKEPYVVTWEADEKLGQAVTLVIESPDGAIDTESLSAICRSILPKHWAPRTIKTMTEIPRTATGKLKRNFLTSGQK